MKTFLALLLSIAGLKAATTNLVFTWDVPTMPGANGYKVYETTGGNRVLLGGATTNRFTVTNWVIGESRTIVVTATNLWGESPDSNAYVAPPAPPIPRNLRPAGFSFTTPVPGVLELSRDLINWQDRLRISAADPFSADIELVQIPSEPLLFGRVKQAPVTTPLPLP